MESESLSSSENLTGANDGTIVSFIYKGYLRKR